MLCKHVLYSKGAFVYDTHNQNDPQFVLKLKEHFIRQKLNP